jgi:tRNA-Thr(GGU) m(6)t(6)A37 methyltransferase TsaA
MTGPSPSGSPHAHPARREDEVKPIGRAQSPPADPAQAPGQGREGAPPAWLVIKPHLAEGIRDLRVGEHIIILTWLDRARRDELSTIPGDNPDSPPLGVFSTRSPSRPNPIGLHRVQIINIDGLRLLVSGLEAVDHTPNLDIKPVLDPAAER